MLEGSHIMALLNIKGKTVVTEGWQEVEQNLHRTWNWTRNYCMSFSLSIHGWHIWWSCYQSLDKFLFWTAMLRISLASWTVDRFTVRFWELWPKKGGDFSNICLFTDLYFTNMWREKTSTRKEGRDANHLEGGGVQGLEREENNGWLQELQVYVVETLPQHNKGAITYHLSFSQLRLIKWCSHQNPEYHVLIWIC